MTPMCLYALNIATLLSLLITTLTKTILKPLSNQNKNAPLFLWGAPLNLNNLQLIQKGNNMQGYCQAKPMARVF